MDKKSFIITISVGIISIIAAISWLSTFIIFGVFQENQITFIGGKTSFGGQYKNFSTSPYTLLFFIGTFFVFGLHLLLTSFNKLKVADLLFGSCFLLMGLFFVILFRFSDIILSSISSLFVIFGLLIISRSIKSLFYVKKK